MSFTHGCLLQVNIVELDHVLKSNASLKIFLIKNISGESAHFLRQPTLTEKENKIYYFNDEIIQIEN